MDEYQRDFVQESEENITELNNALLELERDPTDDAAMDRIFRMAHTLKGNSGAMGFERASNLAHAIEDLLEVVRSGQIDVTADLMDEIFAGVDELETMVDEVRAYGEIRTDPSETIETIREVQEAATGVPTIGEPDDEAIEDAVAVADDLADEDHDVFHVRLAVDESGSVAHGSAVVDALADAFDLLGTVPDRETIAAGEYDGTFDAVFGSAVGEAAISAALDPVEPVAQARINEVTTAYESSRAEPEPAEVGDDEFDDLFEDDPGSEIDPDAAQDMSVDDLLSEFNEYDDLDAMVEEMDDVSGFDDLGDAGSFDDLDLGDGLDPRDQPAEDPLDDEFGGDLEDDLDVSFDEDTGEPAADAEPAEPVEDPDEEVDDAAATFAELKQEVDPVGFDELQDELDELEFDEYADEEEVGFDELLGDDFEESEDDFFGADTEAAVGTDQDEVSVEDLVSDDDVAGFEESEAETPVEPDDPVEAVDTDGVTSDEEADTDAVTADGADAVAADADTDTDAVAADADTPDAGGSEPTAGTETTATGADADGPATDAVDEPETDTAAATDAAADADATTAVDEFGDDIGSDFESRPADDFGTDALDDTETGFDDADEFDDDFGGDGFELDAAEPAGSSGIDDASADPLEEDSFGEDSFEEGSFDDGFADAGSADDGFDEPADDAGDDLGAGTSVDDEDLDRVEVQQFELDDPGTEAGGTTEVETGDFEADADDSATVSQPSAESYGDFGGADLDSADGFDPAPEPETGESTSAADDGAEVSALDVDVGIQTLADEDGEAETDDEIQSIRVDVEQVDRLLNLVEGLVTSRVRLRRTVEEGADPAELDTELDELEDLTGELQDTVMDVRLVPVQMVANRLPRIVRDISREQDKEVEFEMHGEGVEVDRSILDRIGDPLVHIVRNAVDHGIEAPDEREAADKPRTGNVTLDVERARDQVAIEVTDDGRGLDPDRLRDAAVAADVLTEDEATALSDEEAYELIFHPGLSTASEVTDVSGRGVGMDVVKSTVNDLDGSVSVESTPGEGTTIRMLLPVTVAIADVMFVTSGDEEFGVPVKDIQDIGDAADITVEDGQEVVRDGDRTYPLVRLNEALETPGRARNGDGMLLRIRDEVRPVAVHCDQVRGQQEVVVKPFEGVLGGIPGLSGATVLGEGEVVNILDVKTL
ncbi:ATP-binding protein [Haloarchaeobius iranensis]|uniref:Chemotaxis protein CheA n=1 Tax=Haloarchaeobius iranensis TaxID=996166 RepID=A0A1G9WNJ9_9EURY|nr:ATP-binding protein [Haloarchaeobius iranensis]SDM86070.1 two-component system, chemotaxis family, sensor kinase CheA [Haloarchaeobius iranensis]